MPTLVLPLAGGDWRFALILWAIPILFIAALVASVRLPVEPPNAKNLETNSLTLNASLPSWKDGCVWQYGLLLASSAVAFIAVNAYSGTLLRSQGETEALGGFLFVYNAMPLLASFIVLAAPKYIGQRRPLAVSAVLSVAGMAGFIFLDSWASWIAALVIECASTVELILLISLPAMIAKGLAVTRLSAGMTLIGFGIAFALTLVGGWFADITSCIEMALIPSLVFMIAALAALGGSTAYPNYK